jgi:tetratricopeptide (TPR) repeat protein
MDDFETARQFFVEGLQCLETNDFQTAETRFARSLELVPDRVSTLNNLSAVKNRLKKYAEAEKFALKAIALDDASAEACSNLGFALTRTTRHEEALQAYERALHVNPLYADAWLNKAMTLLELERYDEALLACDQALNLAPSQYEVLYTKSLILQELKRTDEALKSYWKSLDLRVDLSPVFIAERQAGQKAKILIINRNPDNDAPLKSFEGLHVGCPNFPGQLAWQFQEDFQFAFVFEREATNRSVRKKIPQPDIVINNLANGERLLAVGNLLALTEAADSFGVPVVNHPTKIIQSTRDTSARLLHDIPGVRVPKTMRFSSIGKTHEELVRELEDQYDYPFITRSLFAQRGMMMTKVDSRDALVEVLSADFPKTFFVTEFVDTKGRNEFFRKIRAAIVKDEIVIVRVDYHTHWNVHGRKAVARVPFYLHNAHLLDVEKQICAHPEEMLGRSALQSLRAIRDRFPLDVFGIDFDVDADGVLVFYEANATMNLFSTAQKEVPNPQQAHDSLKQAFQRYLTSLATLKEAG